MRTVKNPNEIVNDLVADYASATPDGTLVSVIMYGSAVTHEYDPKRSEIHTLVVVEECSVAILERLAAVHKRWRKLPVTAPLVLARSEIAKSLDTFTVEFLDMKSGYRVLHGEDVLKDVQVDREHLRLQCERLLRLVGRDLRRGYIENGDNERRLREIALEAYSRLVPVFKAILALHDKVVPNIGTQVVGGVEDILGLGVSVLSALGTRAVPVPHADAVRELIGTVDAMVEVVDTREDQ